MCGCSVVIFILPATDLLSSTENYAGPRSNFTGGLKQSFYLQELLEVSRFKELNDFLVCSI